jgi:pSer/pThr/pTyr-binding forkhead associated (FHA) protein
MEVTLTINSGGTEQLVAVKGEPLTIGRDDSSEIVLASDKGLSRRHTTFHTSGDQVWVVDEGSTNGSFINGERVAEGGTDLSDGDEIRIGHATVITVNVRRAHEHARSATTSTAAAQSLPLSVRLSVLSVVMVLLCGVGFGLYSITRGQGPGEAVEVEPARLLPTPEPTATRVLRPTPEATPTPAPTAEVPTHAPTPDPLTLSQTGGATRPKLYKQMTEDEKAQFIKERAQHVSIMMGGRPYAIPPEALKLIKFWLDAFASRVGNRRTGLWGGDTLYILDRGKNYAPVIIRAFRDRNVPIVIGVYIPFIETEYTNLSSSNSAGAAGLFQFLGPTAEGYGVPSSERTNVPRMAGAAAGYFRDNIVTFGDGPMGVALSIAGYNRNPESVKRDLRNVLNSANNEDKERSFWTLVANQAQLDTPFQRENLNYVPRFFAAAILGETPWAFGINMRPLSTYTDAGGGSADAPKPVKQ